jgi:NAD+ diphosphatase
MVAAQGDAVLVTEEGTSLARVPVPAGEQPALLLGLQDGRPVYGVDLERTVEPVAEHLRVAGQLVSLRDAGMTLAGSEAGLAAYLVGLTGWHRSHGFCANCGAATSVAEGGLARLCPRCGRSHFPRTDPVVIMLVEHEDRLLLGRRPNWPARRFSLLAGFVACGETPEAAVIREVREESGIQVHSSRYLAAQPWPFPASLMLGYGAVADGGEPRCLDGELEEVAWFSRNQVAAAARADTDGSAALHLPGPVAIARTLIDWWLRITSDRPEW